MLSHRDGDSCQTGCSRCSSPGSTTFLHCKLERNPSCLQVSYSAILFYGYVGVIGLAVWSALRYFKSTVSLSQIWCTYGAPVS